MNSAPATIMAVDGAVIAQQFTVLLQGQTRVFHEGVIATHGTKVIPLSHTIFTKREA